MAQTERAYIRALDGLRGLAILPVTAFHYLGWNLPIFPPGRGTALLGRIVSHGSLGVTLFFALSGYLITGILLDAKGSPNWIPLFLARRALRIFPLYYAALIAIFWITPLVLNRSAHDLFGSVGDHQGYFWIYASNFRIALENRWAMCSANPCALGLDLNHFWSLAVEEHFYLFWPLLVWACSRRALGWLAVALSLCAIGLRYLCASAPGGQWLFAAHVFTPCCMDALLFGGLPAILLRDPPLRERVLRLAPFFLLAPLLRFAIPEGSIREALVPSLEALAFAALVVCCAHARESGLFARAVGWAPLVFLGRISYGLYVVHAPLHRVWAAIAKPAALIAWTGSTALGLILFWLIGLALSTAVAFASFHFFERPLLGLKRYLPGSAREVASAAR